MGFLSLFASVVELTSMKPLKEFVGDCDVFAHKKTLPLLAWNARKTNNKEKSHFLRH